MEPEFDLVVARSDLARGSGEVLLTWTSGENPEPLCLEVSCGNVVNLVW